MTYTIKRRYFFSYGQAIQFLKFMQIKHYSSHAELVGKKGNRFLVEWESQY